MLLSLNFIRSVFNQKPAVVDISIRAVQIDSRQVRSGDLFIALLGKQQDGHQFIEQAIANGAVAVMVNQTVEVSVPIIQVNNTMNALLQLATAWRQQLEIVTLGITGSCGKTTIKQMLFAIFSEAYGTDNCYASPGNYNSMTGVPLSLLQLKSHHRYAILEMGMDHFGEIAMSSQCVQPTVAAISCAVAAHTEFVGDVAGVATAKAEIFQGLQPDGWAVLNNDSEFYNYWQGLIGAQNKIISFGRSDQAVVQFSPLPCSWDVCAFTLRIADEISSIRLPLMGEHNMVNAACATAMAVALGVSLPTVKAGLEKMVGINRRFQRHEGYQNCILIDDAYNANPASVKAAIDVLSGYAGRKILLLGTMRELGNQQQSYHEEVGRYARDHSIDYLFAVGDFSVAATAAFGQHGYFFEDREQLITQLLPRLNANTCIVVKGSLSMNMKEFVDRLLF